MELLRQLLCIFRQLADHFDPGEAAAYNDEGQHFLTGLRVALLDGLTEHRLRMLLESHCILI
ncbi:hypothetical protein D3C78_1070230 [compost metagenome]